MLITIHNSTPSSAVASKMEVVKRDTYQLRKRDATLLRLMTASSSNAVALSVAKNEDMADEATGYIPVVKLQVARAASDSPETRSMRARLARYTAAR